MLIFLNEILFWNAINSWCFPSLKIFIVTGIFSLTKNKWFLRFCTCVCTVKRDQLDESFWDFLFEDDLRCFAAGSLQEEDLSEGQGKHSLGPTCSAPHAVQWTLCTTIAVHHCCCCTPLLLYTTIGVHHCTPLGPTCCKRTPPSHSHR